MTSPSGPPAASRAPSLDTLAVLLAFLLAAVGLVIGANAIWRI
jgi:hypothetical protein